MTGRFFRFLRHQSFQLRLRPLMIHKGSPGVAEQIGKFGPRIRSAHIHNPDRFEPWSWRLDAKEARGLAALDTAPELPLRSDNQMLVQWIRMGGDLDPFAAAG